MSEIEASTAAPVEGAPTEPAAAAPEAPAESPLHDDPAIAALLTNLTPEQRETLLTTGGRNALEAHKAEAKSARAQAQSAADAAKAELAKQVGKALGIIKDDEAPDPVKLTEQLTTVGAEARQAKVELAVFRAALASAADPAALLDSRTFLSKVEALDPSDAAGFTAAITEAVAANPRLGRPVDVTPGMKPNPAQGRSASPPLGIHEQIAAAQKAGDMRAVMRLKASQAINPNN